MKKIELNQLEELNELDLKLINGGDDGDALYYIMWGIGAVVGAIGSALSTSGKTSGRYVAGHHQL